MLTESSLQVSGTLSLSDLVRFQYFHAWRRLGLVSLITLVTPLWGIIGVIAVLSGEGESFVDTGVWYLLMLLFGLFLLVNPYRCARKQYRTRRSLKEPMEFEFSEKSIHLQGPNFSTEISWVLVHGIRETKSLFLIYQSPRIAWILPKQFFRSEDSVASLRELSLRQLKIQNSFANRAWWGSGSELSMMKPELL